MTPSSTDSASVHQRLLNKARSSERTFNELLQYFAMERFLYRLSKSKHADQFVLKRCAAVATLGIAGATYDKRHRLSRKDEQRENNVVAQIKDVLKVKVDPDGLIFVTDSFHTEQISKVTEYEGIRIKFVSLLGTAKIHMQIDIGFGDVVHPKFEPLVLPASLNFKLPRVPCYSRESTVSEKFEAMVKLGKLNSRMKDFYDIWLLSQRFKFTGPELAKAIRLTFERRGTELPAEGAVFTEPFIKDKQALWQRFRNRLQSHETPESFAAVAISVEKFLSPVTVPVSASSSIPKVWIAPGPWA